MAETNWRFTIDPFAVATYRNYKRMISLDADHYAKLVALSATHADVLILKDEYEPFHTALVNIYSNWTGAAGTHEGSTMSVEDLFRQLNATELKKWEGKVRSVFAEDTPQEHSIFPNKRQPFQEGTYEQRIYAIKSLFEKLDTYTTEPVLVTLSATVETFYNTVELARLTQQGNEITTSELSAMLESQRRLCATAMYGNLGRLMYKHRNTPVEIEQYWDMSLLRDTPATNFSAIVEVDAGRLVQVPMTEDQIAAVGTDTAVRLENTSAVTVLLQVGFYDGEDNHGTLIELAPGETRELSAAELGWTSERTLLKINNPGTISGRMAVEIEL